MVEKSYACECHGNAILVASVYYIVIAHRTAGLCYIFHAALVGTLDIVAEWEECIAAQGHFRVFGYPLFLFIHGEYLGTLFEEHLPCAVAKHIVMIFTDVYVDSVVAVGAAYAVDKRQ